MRILFVSPYYAPAYPFGGVVRSAEGMARSLARRGHHVTVLTSDAINWNERTAERETIREGVRVIRIPNAIPALRRLVNLSTPLGMRQTAPPLVAEADIIHVHEFRTAENLMVTPLAERMTKPLFLSPHGTLTMETGRSRLKQLWDTVISPGMARRFTGVIGLTAAEVEEARALWHPFHAPRTQFYRVPNGVDPDEWRDLPGRAAFRARYGIGDAPVVLFLGRLHLRKGVDVLVEAFKRAGVDGARLVIAGGDEGMLDVLKGQIDTETMIFTGFLDDAGRKAALAAADLFALPAVGEGLSMAALEALAAGVPVILSPGCNLPEAERAGAGVIVERDPDEVGRAIRDLLGSPDRRSTMRENARRLIRDQFTWDGAAGMLEQIYQSGITGITGVSIES